MTVYSDGSVVSFDGARRHLEARLAATAKTTTRTEESKLRVHTVVTAPRSVRRMKDVVWTAIISIILAIAAVLVGVVGAVGGWDVVSIVQGAGLASIAFGIAGLSDKFDPRSRNDD